MAVPAGVDAELAEVLGRSRDLGFLGPGPIEDHIEHSLGFAQVLSGPPAGPALDLGSGGGIPGLVLALAWGESTWVLLDSSERRTTFLADAVDRLGLSNRVEVQRGRAEEAGRNPLWRGHFELVVSRSFGPPAVTAECAAPLLAVGGVLVVSEPPAPHSASRWPADGLTRLGLAFEPTTRASYARLRLSQECPERYPRRVGIPAKRPLF